MNQRLSEHVDKMGDQIYVKGSHVRVELLWKWNKAGTSVETLFRRFPSIPRAKILYALAFCHENPEIFP